MNLCMDSFCSEIRPKVMKSSRMTGRVFFNEHPKTGMDAIALFENYSLVRFGGTK